MQVVSSARKGWLAPKGKTWLWGFAFGAASMVLGVNINWGDIGPWAERVGNGVETITNPPTTVAPVTP
jgi:hypothetical protein